MIGAIIGDIVGSVYEWHNVKSTAFELFSRESRFTDDTVMTVSVADAILNKEYYSNPISDAIYSKRTYAYKLREYGNKYPDAGYGQMFNQWLLSQELKPYRSYGNGSAMRASPIGFAFNSLDEVLKEAKRSAVVTHNHRQGIKGSQAIIAFLESEDFEDAIRKAISIGGDSDTIACIAGGIDQAYYKVIPSNIVDKARLILDSGLKRVIDQFNEKFSISLTVYEASIDAISHATILKQNGLGWKKEHKIALGCLSDNSLEGYLKLHPEIKNIKFALDNDFDAKFSNGSPVPNWGQQAAEKLADKYMQLGYITSIEKPIAKNWNEDLLSMNMVEQYLQNRLETENEQDISTSTEEFEEAM